MDTFARRQKERAYLFDVWHDVGYEPFDQRVVYRGNVGDSPMTYRKFENAYFISPNHLTRLTVGRVFDRLSTVGPFFLHVYPSSLWVFIDLFGRKRFLSLPIRGILAGSEAFPEGQMARVREEFRLPIAHWYGHSEYATLGKYCVDCHGFHFYPTYGYTEFVRIDGNNHRIVATSFNSFGTQFVRYDTGDIARLGESTCERPFQRVNGIEGRSQDYFLDAEGQQYSFGPYLFGIHDEFWERIRRIQFVQEEPGQLRVRLVLGDVGVGRWVENYLSERFRLVNLVFEYVDEIEPTLSGKHRYFISKIVEM